jgi:hypothetical protein
MKKIILTLGIFLSAYATYAVNSNEKLEIESNNSTQIVEEDNSCQRIVYHYNEDNTLAYVSVHLC